MLQRKMKLKN